MATITITEDAAHKLEELGKVNGDLAFKIDNGCCGGTTLLLIQGEYLGGGDVHVGDIANVPVYVERAFADGYSSDGYHIYARSGGRDSGFSIEIPHGFKFLMLRTVMPSDETLLKKRRPTRPIPETGSP